MKITLLIIEPRERPRIAIVKSFTEMREIVGGKVETECPYADSVAIAVNEEGKVNGLPLNRCIRDENSGEIIDIAAGTFFICGLDDCGEFISLTPEQATKYEKLFETPEIIFIVDGKIISLPL